MNKLDHKRFHVIQLILITSLITSLCSARENPFFTTSANPSNTVSSQKNNHKPPLTSMTYNFPSNARVLKEASFTFQNLDGSIETRKIEIDHSIDWRLPMILSQQTNKHSEIASQPIPTNNSSLTTAHKIDFIHFIPSKNNLLVQTKNTMVRSFTLSDPSSVIIDFRHNGLFDPMLAKVNTAPFVNVKVAKHKDLARVTLLLDGNHECKALKETNGVNVMCK
jgi:hypothetical protein